MGNSNTISLTPAPDWSLWVGSAGKFFVILAAVCFALSAIGWLLAPRWSRLEAVGKAGFGIGAGSLFATFTALAILFANNRFEFEYVWGHTDSRNALIYRIAGIWSGQEGSFLLWGTCAALFGILAVRSTAGFRRWYTIVYSAFLGAICGILAFESPFNLNLFEGRVVVPEDGVGLSPALQNYWVTIHPPTIFLGFASLTIPFALAVAAMMRRDYESWIPIVRPWAIVSATLVGVGLCMGGFWAYETLGWGGFWMWDPVENVSFVPWCFGIAFIHGMIVQTTRKKWQLSNLLLGGLPFIAFVYGTFLTRSGFLSDTSVHSFAEMNRSALWQLMAVMIAGTVGFAGLWFVRMFQAKRDAESPSTKGWSREGFYRFGAIFLVAMGLAAMIGMSVPFFKALAGQSASVVEEGLYHMVLPWIYVPLMLVMAVAPFVSWRGMGARDLTRRIYSVLCVTIGLAGLLLIGLRLSPLARIADLAPTINFPMGWKVVGLGWVVFLACLSLFVTVANGWRMAELAKGSKLGWGSFVSHIGIAMLMAGLILSRGFERRGETVVMEDHPGRALTYTIEYKGMTSDVYDRENKVEFEVTDPHNGDKTLFTARPGLYYVPTSSGEENAMVWPHIQRFLGHDVYFTLRPPQTQGSAAVTIAPGETQPIGGYSVKYVKMVREGEVGVPGTRFGAQLEVTGGDETLELVPHMEISETGGINPHPAAIDDLLSLTMVAMDAATQSVTLQLQLNTPMYPIEIFHKPFTLLVWIGTGVMALGGFMAAVYRRPRKSAPRGASSKIEHEETLDDREPVGVG